jgi:hypothetical protein
VVDVKRQVIAAGFLAGLDDEDAARMRVNRALEKLQVFLKQRGVTVTAAVLGAALASDTIVPSGLAATLATNALAAASTGGIAALTKFMGISTSNTAPSALSSSRP